SPASATRKFWTAAPAATTNISRSAAARPASRYGCAPSATRQGTTRYGARRGEALPPQIRPPGVPHRVEQPHPRLLGLQEYEPPRRGVVRRGRGDRERDRPPYRRPIHRLLAGQPP